MRKFNDGTIHDVIVRDLSRHTDQRGWLMEIFRADELPPALAPVMTYVSETKVGGARGPHEHVDQTDLFGFLGPSDFKVYLWDNRPDSPTCGNRMTVIVGERRPALVVIPPRVVHAYRNVGTAAGWVVNCPNRLYRGAGRREAVDEIRHEDQPDSPFVLD